ncbi:probable cytochrome P450 110 [Aspergillus lentulus]|uniref:Probable cytochrome P450 110 n=1 Tax=Aspergillus lentulus TaxID=293939 RepID=A0AAN4PDX4_ASPLE|nr:probable cytochrome P450 110 [Aspergillus lentulus]
MFLLTIVAISTLLVLLLYKFLIAPYFLSPLSRIPNAHFTAPISDYWIEGKRRSGQEVLTIYDLHRKHGPVVRLGPNELSVNSLRGLQVIYTGAFEKHSFYRDAFVNFLTDNLVGMLPNNSHARQKRMLSKIYSKSYLHESADLRNISSIILSQRLLPILKKVAEKGEAINVLPLFQAVGMDFTSAFLFGTANSTTFLFDLPGWAEWLVEYERFKYLSLEERYLGFIESWCLSLCSRMQGNEHPNDVPVATNPVVYTQLRQGLEKHPDQRPLELALASELLDHLVAGHETSGITFVYMMWELSKRPRLQAELRRELLTLTPSLRYPSVELSNEGLPTLPSPAAIDSLPLLDAIVRETLRVHSPAPAPLPRVTPSSPGGIKLEEYDRIPGGVKVSSSAYTLHRISEVYPQPFEWLPERWLEPGPGKIHDMRRLFWPFGSGGKMCLGSNFALQEIKLVMAAVYTNYTTSIVDDEGIEQDYAFISLPKGRKLMLKFTPVKL